MIGDHLVRSCGQSVGVATAADSLLRDCLCSTLRLVEIDVVGD